MVVLTTFRYPSTTVPAGVGSLSEQERNSVPEIVLPKGESGLTESPDPESLTDRILGPLDDWLCCEAGNKGPEGPEKRNGFSAGPGEPWAAGACA